MKIPSIVLYGNILEREGGGGGAGKKESHRFGAGNAYCAFRQKLKIKVERWVSFEFSVTLRFAVWLKDALPFSKMDS